MPSIRARTEAFDRNSFCRSYIQGLYKYNQTSPFGLSSDSGNACHKAHNNNTILCCHPRFPRKETKAWSAHFLILSALIAFECDAFISTRSVASNKRRLSDLTTLEPTKSHGGGTSSQVKKRFILALWFEFRLHRWSRCVGCELHSQHYTPRFQI